jgi:hypothetical protein
LNKRFCLKVSNLTVLLLVIGPFYGTLALAHKTDFLDKKILQQGIYLEAAQ